MINTEFIYISHRDAEGVVSIETTHIWWIFIARDIVCKSELISVVLTGINVNTCEQQPLLLTQVKRQVGVLVVVSFVLLHCSSRADVPQLDLRRGDKASVEYMFPWVSGVPSCSVQRPFPACPRRGGSSRPAADVRR